MLQRSVHVSRRLLAIGSGAAVLLAVAGWFLYNAAFAPIDDPSHFCQAPDPSPIASIAASVVLEDCAAGKTVSVAKDQIVAIDLQNARGVDTWTQWTDLSISDGQVLSTVSGLTQLAGEPPVREDDVALFRAMEPGQATITVLAQYCTANGGGSCGRSYLWRVTVRVG